MAVILDAPSGTVAVEVIRCQSRVPWALAEESEKARRLPWLSKKFSDT